MFLIFHLGRPDVAPGRGPGPSKGRDDRVPASQAARARAVDAACPALAPVAVGASWYLWALLCGSCRVAPSRGRAFVWLAGEGGGGVRERVGAGPGAMETVSRRLSPTHTDQQARRRNSHPLSRPSAAGSPREPPSPTTLRTASTTSHGHRRTSPGTSSTTSRRPLFRPPRNWRAEPTPRARPWSASRRRSASRASLSSRRPRATSTAPLPSRRRVQRPRGRVLAVHARQDGVRGCAGRRPAQPRGDGAQGVARRRQRRCGPDHEIDRIVMVGVDQMAFYASYMRHLLTLLDLRAEVVASASQEALGSWLASTRTRWWSVFPAAVRMHSCCGPRSWGASVNPAPSRSPTQASPS